MQSAPIYYFSPVKSVFGAGCVSVIRDEVATLGARRVLIMTDAFFGKSDLCRRVQAMAEEAGARVFVWDKVQPNPTDKNVEEATQLYKQEQGDLIISLGGGSPHDCAKAVAIMATNEGRIQDYEGVDQVRQKPAPLFSVNTTAGTAAELTRFSIITDTARKIKMALIDWQLTPLLAVNDPETMVSMPQDLTAATGMDAMTHSVEAYVSTAANVMTDANALTAIKLISDYLPRAYRNGQDMEAREKMAYAQYLGGLAFNNASLGYVHAIAHQLGGYYDLPHGVCNSILLPVVQKFNRRAAAGKLAEISDFLRLTDANASVEEKADAFLAHLNGMKAHLNIPANLEALGVVSPDDFELMAKNAMQDPCGLTNPVQPTLQEVIGILEEAYATANVSA